MQVGLNHRSVDGVNCETKDKNRIAPITEARPRSTGIKDDDVGQSQETGGCHGFERKNHPRTQCAGERHPFGDHRPNVHLEDASVNFTRDRMDFNSLGELLLGVPSDNRVG